MVKNLTPPEIYRFITSDFQGAWDSIAANSHERIGRGNFMFARQAMNLLEFAARLYTDDTTNATHRTFSSNLWKIEPKYFTKLPGTCAVTTEFILPSIGPTAGDSLLDALFDLVRNGPAHQYQQLVVKLNDGKHFYISLTGPTYGKYLDVLAILPRPQEHLAYTFDCDGDLELKLCPEVLFLDLEKAIHKSNLLKSNLSFGYLSRPKSKNSRKFKGPGNYYNFDKNSLEKTLMTGRHIKFYHKL